MNRPAKLRFIFLLPLATVTMAAWSADPTPKPRADNPKFEYFGSSNCQRCHFQPIQQDIDEGRTHFLGMNESQIWMSHDRHSKAFKLLQCERGQAIGRRLGWNVAEDQRCLSCHADWQASRAKPDDSMLTEGVACEACHGASSRYINEHTNSKWRAVSFHDRSADYGMLMLRDPKARAEVCLSCHIGDAEQGKVITHEMYAAGHPPLPGFELRNFGESMKHWSDISEQLTKIAADRPPRADETSRDLQFIRSQLCEDLDTNAALKTVLYGAVMTLRQSVQLLASAASGMIDQKPDTKQFASNSWPEFSLFDCAMCHHDLRYPAWRQTRSSVAPGRPQIPRWPQALVVVAIEQAAGTDRSAADQMNQTFATLVEELDKPFRGQPFGDPKAVAEPAMKLVAFLDRLLEQLKPLKLNREAAELALKQLCDVALNGTPDYDSARQIAWAFQNVYTSLDPRNVPGAAGGNAIPASERIDQELGSINAELRLSLNPLRADAKDVCSQAIADGDLQDAMKSAETYSPQRFQQHFQTLQRELTELEK